MIMKAIRLMISMAAIAAMTVACSDELEQAGTSQLALNSSENAVNFSTYMGRSSITRGGAYGSIDTEKLADPNYGFGVFAYYTGTTDYSGYRTRNAVAEHYPNFMYNEHIVGDGNGAWKYADVRNTKYWPNEVGTGAVDDQNNDSGNDPATTDYANGGKVSFYAYAPYAKEGSNDKSEGITGNAVSTTDNDGTQSGIIAFSGNHFNGAYADNTPVENERCQYSDPYLQYRISTDSKKQVDLLWGTAGTNGVNVLTEEQKGTLSDAYPELTTAGLPLESRPSFFVNSNLTKQKTNGTVEFAFKHALAKIGGSYIGAGEGDDEDGKTPTNGLMVILDIDKDGQELGGSLQEYAEGAKDGTPYNTKVTINEIVLESEKQLTEAGLKAIKENSTFEYNDTYVEPLSNQGIFNLVTGVWHDIKSEGSTKRVQDIVPTDVNLENDVNNDADNEKDAVLSNELAEPKAVNFNWTNAYTKDAFEALPIGVTTVAKNVYESDAQPFVFMPGSYPIITITIDYTVRTYDAKLAKKYTEVRQKVTKRLYILEEIQLNKQYNILMHLGLTSVKFTASVSDWEAVSATGSTIDPGDGSSPISTFDDEVEHVWLPINVAGITSVNMGSNDYDMPADNTITLDEQGTAEGTINLGAITFTRADGTELVTNKLSDGSTIETTCTNLTGVPAGQTFATVANNAGSFTITVPANTGVSRSDMVTIVVKGPDGVKLATLNIIVPQKGAMATPEAAVAYNYSDRQYKGKFTAVDDNNIDYDIDITNVGDGGKNIMNDFARILGALYRAGGVKEINFGGNTYTWDEAGTLKGSNFKNEAGITLVAAFVEKFSTLLGPGQFKLTLGTDRGDITFNAHVKSSAELAAEYEYTPAYTYKGTISCAVNNVTYTITEADAVANGGRNIMNDMARFLGALYRNGGVTSLTYNGKAYTWDETKGLEGSNWVDASGKTLVSVLAYDYRNGVPNGTQLKLTTNMGDIVFTIVIE